MTNPTTNFGWVMPSPTDLVTDLPADFEVFGQAVDTDFVDLLGGANGYILSKASATDLDFAWIPNDQGDITAVTVTAPITGGGTSGSVGIAISSATTSASGAVQLSDSTSTTSSVLASTPTATKAAYDLANTANTAAGAAQTTANAAIPKSTVTTAGDVIYATGSAAVTRLGIGTAGQVLTVNGGATAPSWVTPSTSGITLLSTTTLTGASTAISSISQSYKNLYVSVEGAYAATSGSTIQIQGNTSNSFQMVGSYNVAGAGSPNNYSQTWNSSLNLPLIAGSAIGGYLTSAWAFSINNYASTTFAKPVNLTGFWRGSATSDNNINAGGSYNATSAISTLTFSMSAGNLGGGTVKVYGVN
jgi:hypothetical protein